MAKGADERREDRYDHFIEATSADMWAAYLDAVADRDLWVWAYVTVCLYVPTPSVRDCGWQLELISTERRA